METMTEPVKTYSGLTNTELALIYYKFKSIYDNLNNDFANKLFNKVVDTPMGRGTAVIPISEEQIREFKQTIYYKSVKDVVNKLTPIVTLLEEENIINDELLKELR